MTIYEGIAGVNTRKKGIVLVLICVALWALIPVVAKLGQTSLNHSQFLFWSSLVSFVVLLITASMFGNIREVKFYTLRDWLYLTFLGLLGTYIYYLFLYLGYARATGIEVLVFQYTWPIFIMLFSIVLFHESVHLRQILALLLGVLGVLVVLSKGRLSSIHIPHLNVILLVTFGAACFGLFSVLSKRVKKDPFVVVAYYFLVASMAAFVSMIFTSGIAYPSRNELLPILMNGILINGLSYVFWQIALRSTDASFLAPFTFLTPILSAFYLVLFFHETFLPSYGVGLACIVAAGLFNSMGRTSNKLR